MIRAILRRGKIEPLEKLPVYWREGQELTIEGSDPSGDPTEIRKWYEKLETLSARIPPRDHMRLAAALEEQDRQAKEQMRREMGLH